MTNERTLGMRAPWLLRLALLALGLALLAGRALAGGGAPARGAMPNTPARTVIAFQEGFETTSQFSRTIANCNDPNAGWNTVATAGHTGTHSFFAPDVPDVCDQWATMDGPVALPPTTTGGSLTFYQKYDFETGSSGTQYDGGVLEISTNGGTTWVDAAALITTGGYTGTIPANGDNPLAGRQAWGGNTSGAWVPVEVSLGLLAGHSAMFRWRLGTNSSGAGGGWWIDDVTISYDAPGPCSQGWTAGPSYPSDIQDPAVVALNNSVYVFGGNIPGSGPTAQAYRYDVASNAWTPIAPLPAARSAASAVTDGTYLYIVNGSDAAYAPTHTLYRYNPGANSYTTLSAPPTATSAQGAAYLGGKIYRVAGNGSPQVTNTVEQYTVATNTWTTTTAYPQALRNVAVVAVNGYIYGAGGHTTNDLFPTAKTYRFAPATQAWDDLAIADLPGAVTEAGSALYNGRWFVIAGATPNYQYAGVLTWDPATGTWASVAPVAAPVYGLGAAATAGMIVAAGGRTYTTYDDTRLYNEFTCPAATATPTAPPAPSSTPIPSATATPGSLSPTPTSTACALSFGDVHPTDYFYTPVTYLACHGVISGYADGTFRPYANTTRAQMVKIVVLGLGVSSYTPPGGAYTFADVPPAHPFFAVVEAAAHAGVVSGYACGGSGEPCDTQQRPYFRPNANVTRGQLAKIVVGATAWPLRNPAAGSFADVAPGSAFYAFVETAACHGIISGYACGGPGEPCDAQQRPYFRPGANATRGQIAKIVYGTIQGGTPCGP